MKQLFLAFVIFAGFSSPILAVEITINDEKIDVPVCGGFAGLTCGESEWCDYPDATVCGGADQFGVCRPRPDFCTMEYRPVCGCDGKTYSNPCHAAANGTDVAHAGLCIDTQ